MGQKTNAPDADGEVVWSWRPDAGAKFLLEAIPARATGAKEPGPRGEHDISRKPPRAGMPGDSGVLVVTNARAFYTTLHARLRVHWAPGIPHTLSGGRLLQTSGATCRGKAILRFDEHARAPRSVVIAREGV